MFVMTAGGVLAWCIVWMLMVTDSPLDHPRISAEERTYIVTSLKGTISMSKVCDNMGEAAHVASSALIGSDLQSHVTSSALVGSDFSQVDKEWPTMTAQTYCNAYIYICNWICFRNCIFSNLYVQKHHQHLQELYCF